RSTGSPRSLPDRAHPPASRTRLSSAHRPERHSSAASHETGPAAEVGSPPQATSRPGEARRDGGHRHGPSQLSVLEQFVMLGRGLADLAQPVGDLRIELEGDLAQKHPQAVRALTRYGESHVVGAILQPRNARLYLPATDDQRLARPVRADQLADFFLP